MGVNLRGTLPELLRARGMTQEELATRSKIRRTDINAIAKGRIQVGPARLQRLAAALEVSVLELAPETEPDRPGLLILDRLQALEDALNELGPELAKLGRRVRALERPDHSKTQPRNRQ